MTKEGAAGEGRLNDEDDDDALGGATGKDEDIDVDDDKAVAEEAKEVGRTIGGDCNEEAGEEEKLYRIPARFFAELGDGDLATIKGSSNGVSFVSTLSCEKELSFFEEDLKSWRGVEPDPGDGEGVIDAAAERKKEADTGFTAGESRPM